MWLNIDAGDIQSTDWFSVHAIVRKPCSRTGTRGGNWLIVLWKYPAAERLEGGLEQIGALLEAIDHLVEPDRTATRRHAVPLVLGTSVEVAEPAKIAVADRFDQKHVELLAHHAGAGSALKRSAQRTCSRATERAEAILRID